MIKAKKARSIIAYPVKIVGCAFGFMFMFLIFAYATIKYGWRDGNKKFFELINKLEYALKI